ncbi:MAG: type II secretion system F family protein [Acetivibrionales bacterium]
MEKLILQLFKENTAAAIAIFISNMLAACIFAKIYYPAYSRRVRDALGPRAPRLAFNVRCSLLFGRGVAACERLFGKGRLLEKAGDKMRKAGYRGKYAAIIYLLTRYVFSPLLFLAAFIINFPGFIRASVLVVLVNAIMEAVISSRKRKVGLRFQKYIYKIYKYLHNQVSSGIKPTDALRSAYEVTDDRELREILIRLAARYELTLDIDSALEEFRSNFDMHEAETLCIALKQGVETGDNKELLAKQEELMFNKYFNYIQAETDDCRNRSLAAAAVFVAIVSIMIIVPLLNEMGRAIGSIFIN